MVKQAAPPPDSKRELAALARAARGGLINVPESARALGLSTRAASARLAAWTRAGWLARIRRGTYLVLPLESESEGQTTVEDPWLLATALYSPCYIGGWSAAEHWGLTEQLFRTTFVATAAHIRTRTATFLGAAFTLARVKPERVEHLTPLWRGSARVFVSNRERTIVDAAIDPRWLGGFRHLADVFATYRDDPKADSAALLQELRRSENGAAAKRIGYLAEGLWPSAHDLIKGALASRSKGIIKLDPAVDRRGRMNARWRIWANVTVNDVATQT
jgi:predicted transcriptional regulator of viral defense system